MRGVLRTADSSCILCIVALQYASTNNRSLVYRRCQFTAEFIIVIYFGRLCCSEKFGQRRAGKSLML